MKKIPNYINGKLEHSSNLKYIDVFNPSTGKIYAKCPDSTKIDLDKAIKSAKNIFPKWSSTTNEYRSNLMMKIADEISKNHDKFAVAESIDNGKPISLSNTVDIPRSINNLKFYASSIINFSSQSHNIANNSINYTLRKPIGIVGCISPWNLPLYLFTWKIAPALITGNCVIAKPSEITPMTAYLFSKICIKVGLPKGVLSILHGKGNRIGRKIVSHPEIKAISFTGGTETGKQIAEISSKSLKKISLELGGKNPIIIFDDCNYKKMLDTTIRSSFENQGQVCLSGERILIQNTIYDKFKDDFIKKIKTLKIGDPLSKNTDQGAIISKEHLKKINAYVKIGVKDGGTILIGGKPKKLNGNLKDGYYFEPTVLEHVSKNSISYKEEIFGPVVTIHPFKDKTEAIALANNSNYGLSASIWTSNLELAHNIAEKIETGIIWINNWMLRDLRTSFGGIKNSGIGREGGNDSLLFFTEPKNVCVDYN